MIKYEMFEENKNNVFECKRIQLMIMMSQTLGICSFNNIPTVASSHGTTGCIIAFVLIYIFLGIPLMYMESVIGQFTGRDCLDIWKIRPCFSHFGYVLLFVQIITLIYNHTFVSFIVHYLFISFENPIPYYQCGSWSTRYCNILMTNYTVNENCIRYRYPEDYCDQVHTTFPEYQYWRNYVLEVDKSDKLRVAWRVCLASGLVCIVLFLSYFKRKKSFEWILSWLPMYPILAYLPVMMGSMLQKGLVVKYEEALDLDFSDFIKKFRLSNIIQQVVYNLGVGSGLTCNFASRTSFRANCFFNSVISVVISAFFSVITICTTAMMTCPYAYVYEMSPGTVIKSPMSLVFEKIPRLLSQYDLRLFWLILIYSCYTILGLCTNILLFYNVLETAAIRNQKVAKYPGLTCLVAITFVFCITIPLQSNIGINIFALAFRRYVTLITSFIAMIECLVFIVWYGVNKFSEDVHFMLGIQPTIYMKFAWLVSSPLLAYALGGEIMYYYYNTNLKMFTTVDIMGLFVLSCMCGVVLLLLAGRMLVAACRQRFSKIMNLEATWGPKSDILLRSRAMFSAQAMTKEYMYRQYHLQAGIMTRQRNSNKRNVYEFDSDRH